MSHALVNTIFHSSPSSRVVDSVSYQSDLMYYEDISSARGFHLMVVIIIRVEELHEGWPSIQVIWSRESLVVTRTEG